MAAGIYTGRVQDLLTFVANFNLGVGGGGTFIAGSLGKDPRDL